MWVNHMFYFVISPHTTYLSTYQSTIDFFQPVPWQGGFKNPYSGIIVWPEPDPVKMKLTLFKVNNVKLKLN